MNCTITPKRTHFSVKRKIEDVLEFPFRQQKDSINCPLIRFQVLQYLASFARDITVYLVER